MTTGNLDCEDHQWLQISLTSAQLVSVQFLQDIYTRAVSGKHWISADGVDFASGPGERVKLSAGLALIDGEGLLQLEPATAQKQHQEYPFPWPLPQYSNARQRH